MLTMKFVLICTFFCISSSSIILLGKWTKKSCLTTMFLQNKNCHYVFNRKPVSGDKHKSCHDIRKKPKAFSNNFFVNTQLAIACAAPARWGKRVCGAHNGKHVWRCLVRDLYVKLIIFYFKLRHTQVLYLFMLMGSINYFLIKNR